MYAYCINYYTCVYFNPKVLFISLVFESDSNKNTCFCKQIPITTTMITYWDDYPMIFSSQESRCISQNSSIFPR